LQPEARLARRIYRGAAIYGVLVLLPAYLIPLPDPYKLTQIGFVGLALVFQGLFWTIGGDPLRYRALVPLTVFEKLCFGMPAVAFWARGQTDDVTAAFGAIDLVLAALFMIAWSRLRRVPA
jgi:1,4-dihydroxy-2-naphthoate octaprenyltransferase